MSQAARATLRFSIAAMTRPNVTPVNGINKKPAATVPTAAPRVFAL